MAKTAARTGIMPTALVAIEQSFPKEKRIIDDGLAYRMLPFGAKMLVCLLRLRWLRDWFIATNERSNPGIWGGLLCRKRHVDKKLVDASGQMEAIVNLGAGFDTRAYRLEAISKLPVWELDQQGNVESKEKRLNEIFGRVPSNVKLVAIDFDHESLGAVLASHGYLLTRKTAFIWEGVSQYLTEEGVRAMFDFLAKAAIDSRLAFTYVRKSFLDGKALYGLESNYKRFVLSKVWLFGMEPEAVPTFLVEYGWGLIEDFGYDELAAKYITPCHRDLVATPVERVVYAKKLEQ